MKKKARSPILKGFGKLSCAVGKFTGQQYFVLGCGVLCLLLHFAAIERVDARAVKGVVLQMPMFAQTLFHHLIPLPVNAVVEKNTVVADAPLAQGVVVVEA